MSPALLFLKSALAIQRLCGSLQILRFLKYFCEK